MLPHRPGMTKTQPSKLLDAAPLPRPMHCARFRPILGSISQENPENNPRSNAMNPPVAARASHAKTPSLHDRLKDPSLLREQCYIDGAWVGTSAKAVTNPVNGVELAKIPVMSTAEATQAVET